MANEEKAAPETKSVAEQATKIYEKTAEKIDVKAETKVDAAPEVKEETKSEEKPAEVKTESEVKPEVKPETKPEIKYELKLPEGSLLDSASLEKIASFAKEQGFSQEVAQKLVDDRSEAVTSYRENLVKGHEKLSQETWVSEAKADKEIGQAKFNESIEMGRRFLDAVATTEFKQMLVDTGYGNHKEVIRTFARAAKLIGEDRLVKGGQAPSRPLTAAEKIYGAQKQ